MLRTPSARLLLVVFFLAAPGVAFAQQSDDDWNVAIYPVLGWVPLGIEIDVTLPPVDGGGGGFQGEIVDSRFDGALVGGLSLQKGAWRMDFDGVWAAVGGDRELPRLRVDADLIYFHASGGRKVVSDLYLTGGLRRLALKYDIEVLDLPSVERKPGVWDPLVGVGWHTERDRYDVHATFEAGGFGAGADVELAGSFRADWKLLPHFGLTGGYQWIYFKVEDTDRIRPILVEQTLHGPIVGVGFYF